MLSSKRKREKPSAIVLVYEKKTSRRGQSAGERLTASVNRLQVDAAGADRAGRRTAALR